MRHLSAALLIVLALAAAGCATRPVGTASRIQTRDLQQLTVMRSFEMGSELEDRVLALDPTRVSDDDVRRILAAGPTPRILNLHGGIYPVHVVMESFSRFLTRMGYPEAKIRHPGDGRLSHTPYEPSSQIAGVIAWYYEQEGMTPMLIGHSQGGIQAVKVLYEFAGAFSDRIQVWNPLTDAAEDRTTIIDPMTGRERPVVGLRVGYVSVVGAGGAALMLPNQWSMAPRLRTIPDTVEEFTGYTIGVDMVAWDFSSGASNFRSNGSATVRNVRLPAEYSHVTVASTSHLAREEAMRDWINAYRPGEVSPMPEVTGSTDNALWAADVWFSIKKHWVIEAQRLIRARRALAPQH